MGTRTVDVVDLFDARIHRAQWRIALYVYILERKVWQLDGQPSHGVVSFCDAQNQKCLSKFEYEEISKRAGNVPAVEQNRGEQARWIEDDDSPWPCGKARTCACAHLHTSGRPPGSLWLRILCLLLQ